ncbi:band 4.1-like protein 2 isoform X11 [Dasypus novemcinctus]|uniref:band 4.1-like protein 2 isoform X11 n=1 Tax=Dasypus novemcinctus TaxID=9361 RepID=UPI002660016F|nr:band 4.1-like protein 2 isoform X11 [Dasypus novemcinctus]XP_058163439.1 band 4.1-like protein 2 isoform X11 [Dasypus novemcinctus]XP_058163440.1 band 4.1-like protein 2 isoform X11 [Dasypus novemcinctus]
MTTEVSSASEVKKESDQLEADATHEKPKEVVENEQNSSSDPEEEKPLQSSPAAESQSGPRLQKREKDLSESRGISRFIPPWLKKQKSYNLVVAKDGGIKKEPAQAVVEEQILDKEESLLEGERQAKGDAEETGARKQHKIMVEVKEEKPSVSSVETQPAEEEGKKREEEKVKEIQADKPEGEAAKRETKEVQTNELKAEKASLKTTKKTKTVQCKVTLLDGTELICDVEKRAKGQVLFEKVCEHLNLLEKDYFGLLFQENPEQKSWLDPAKEIKRQLRNLPWLFTFNVKFYPPDPSQLTEDITRYFLCLQLRQDIISGRLPCSFVTHALLGSYTLQAELGDYDPEEHGSSDLSDFQFAPTQTKELEEKVAELHKTHRGLSPAQADSQFLENAKRLSMYGVDLHQAKDSEGVDIKLGVCANGLLIYKDRLRINRFAWPKILKISYKRSNFYIKVRPAELEQFESTIGFKLPNHRAAKRLWKVCVEHHTFYRLVSPEQPPKAKFLTLGSKFRYSGRTQAQTRQASTLIDRPAPHFDRTSSKRVSRSLDGAPIGVMDQSLMKDFPGPAGEVSADGPGISPAVVQDGIGKREVRSPTKAAHLQLIEGKSLEEEITSILFSEKGFSDSTKATFTSATTWTAEGGVVNCNAPSEKLSSSPSSQLPQNRAPESEGPCTGASDAVKSSHETLNVVEEKKQAEVGKDERVSTEEVNGKELSPGRGPGESCKVEPLTQKDSTSLSSESSSSGNESEEEEEDVGEYRPHHRVTEGTIREEQESEEETEAEADRAAKPPVVKTEMVTISDASQRTEISTKEVPIVQTETKTITYESPQIDGGAAGDSGTLLTAQTITAESVSTTTTTHITKTVKGGISETRIEKRIVITGDADIDHDQALAQAIREAREQHPDMSVTRVVVHKETELEEEGDE